QALANLLDNALTHGGGPISLFARPRNGLVELHVTDEGSGFPPGFAARAFDRFSRADEARGRGGTGLGLSIVELIAKAHGGEVGADPGGGPGSALASFGGLGPGDAGRARATACPVLLPACSSVRRLVNPASVAFPALGTTALLWVTDAAALPRAHEILERELEEIDGACSRFRDGAELARLNRAAGSTVGVSRTLLEALETAVRAAAATGGLVDP